jgi:lipopolysaccharide heptosyltransferase II
VRARRYDRIVDLQGLLKSALAARFARGGRVLGPSYRREGSGLFYSDVAGSRDRDRHIVDQALDAVRFLGLPLLPPEFPVRFPVRAPEGDRPRVALVPLSRWPTKNWPPERFAAVAEVLRRTRGASIFIFGAPADRPVCERLAAGLPGARNLAGTTSLVDMGSWFATMDLVISNDSGPMHLAAAIGIPVLAIFGPTDPLRTGPFGTPHRVITAPAECRPCFRASCRRGGECLTAIGAERVAEAAERMLDVAQARGQIGP